MAHPRAFARLIAAHGVPVYFNFFARVGDGSPAAGAFHSAQGDFFMGLPKLPASLGHTPYDASLSRTMTGYLVAFAATGDPNGGARPLWPKCPPGSGKYFELGRDVIENRDLRKGEVGRPRSGSREVTVQSGHGVDRLRRQRDMRAVGSAVRLDFAAIVNGRRRITRFSCFNRS